MDGNDDPMMKWAVRYLLLAGIVSLLSALLPSTPSYALSLKMQPLIYKDVLKKGEKKKGFVDVSNPTPVRVKLKTSVQAFRQIDDKGGLQFYDDQQVSAGIKTDLDEIELGPHEAIRMYFLIDGTKLPSGDVFAAVFVSTISDKLLPGTDSSLRLGTLLTLTNGTPGSRDAEITHLHVPFWQFGDEVSGEYTVKNAARAGTATGFFPSVTVAIDPFRTQKQVESSLVFAGRARQNDFDIRTSRIGLYKVSVTYGGSTQKAWVFVVTGYWRIVVVAALLVLVIAGVIWRRLRSGKSLIF